MLQSLFDLKHQVCPEGEKQHDKKDEEDEKMMVL